MAHDLSAAPGDVVEWGDDDTEPRRGLVARRLVSLRWGLGINERHLMRTAAGAGAVLCGLSLVTTWQITTLTGEGDSATVETTVAGLEAWGAGYLLGLMGLFALTGATLFGAPQIRRHLRVPALGWAVAVLGVLLAAAANMNTTSVVLRYSYFVTGDGPNYELAYGPGPFFAIGGVAGMMFTLYLSERVAFSDRSAPAPAQAAVVPDQPVAAPVAVPVKSAARHGGAGTAGGEPGPADLTVRPVTPFVHLPEQRDHL